MMELENGGALQNQERYVGNKVTGLKEGFGTLYDDENEIVYEGEWYQDSYHGRGRVFNRAEDMLND